MTFIQQINCVRRINNFYNLIWIFVIYWYHEHKIYLLYRFHTFKFEKNTIRIYIVVLRGPWGPWIWVYSNFRYGQHSIVYYKNPYACSTTKIFLTNVINLESFDMFYTFQCSWRLYPENKITMHVVPMRYTFRIF